jgi:hypothetical protein
VAIVEGSWLLLLLGFSIGLVIVEAFAITGAGTAALAAAVEREASGADLAVEQLTSPFSKASSVFVDLSAMLLTDLTTETKDMGQVLLIRSVKNKINALFREIWRGSRSRWRRWCYCRRLFHFGSRCFDHFWLGGNLGGRCCCYRFGR